MSNETADVEEPCLSEEINRASESYRVTALVTAVIIVCAVLSGALPWWKERKNIWLKRRNPGILWLTIIPIVALLVEGPIFRFTLNDPESFFQKCFVVNFGYLLVVPTFIIPSTARIISFYYRLKLHQKLSEHHRSNKVASSAENSTKPPKNPVFFRAKVKKSFLFQFEGSLLDTATFSEIRYARFKAGWRFAFGLAVGWMVVSFACAFVYASFMCKVFDPNQETCEFSSNNGFQIIFLLIPLIPALALYLYFRNLSFVKEAPDPFCIKRELDSFMFCLFLGLIVIVLNFIDPGNFAKTGKKSEEDINFKWIQLVDVIVLLGALYIFHWQIYKAIKFNSSFKRVIPMGLDEILQHRDGSELYEVFLQTDFSVENLISYRLMSQWKEKYNTLSPDEREGQARNIFRQWLDPSAIDGGTVNVSGKSIRNISLALESKENIQIDLFDEIICEVFELMEIDSFIRFVQTDEYKIFVGAQDAENIEDEL